MRDEMAVMSKNSDWKAWLAELSPDVAEVHAERKAFSTEHSAAILQASPISSDLDGALWRFRGLAAEAIRRWSPTETPLERFLQLAIVDAHDAAVDALASILSGTGPPAFALVRRLYELTLVLTAGWQDPKGLLAEMQKALAHPYTDDRCAELAALGIIGAVMPSSRRLRTLALGPSENLDDVETGLKSVGHGGLLAAPFYMAEEPDKSPVDNRVWYSLPFVEIIDRTTCLAAAASARIAERLGYALRYEGADDIFEIEVIEAREDAAVRAFDQTFPFALDILWATYIGIGSIATEMAEHIGSRPYDPLRRQVMVMWDALHTAWAATEALFRGRLVASGTLVRRLFELSLEEQAWALQSALMEDRFNVPAKPGRPAPKETTPGAGGLIRLIYGKKSASLQRRTYSTLCSVAHGGAQAQAFLLDTGKDGQVCVQPAPNFAFRHHSWLLGTLVSCVDALLGASLTITDRLDPNVGAGHWGYLANFRAAYKTIPGLTLAEPELLEPKEQ